MVINGLRHFGTLSREIVVRSQRIGAGPEEDRSVSLWAREVAETSEDLLALAESSAGTSELKKQCVEIATLALRLADALLEVENEKEEEK